MRNAVGLLAVGVVLAGIGLLATNRSAGETPRTAARSCVPDTGIRDLDGDHAPDVVVGMPRGGAVDVRYSGRPSEVVRPRSFGPAAGNDAAFGSAVAMGDLDGDGCADLVVGAPGQAPPDAATQATGVVHILFGGPTGLDLAHPLTVTHPVHDASYADGFGATLAVVGRRGQLDPPRGLLDLYVGAPDLAVGSQEGAGGVFHYVVAAGGPHRVTVTAAELRTQDSPGVPGVAEGGDHLGAQLAGDTAGGVVASAPGEDIGRATDAGAIWYLGTRRNGLPGTSVMTSQDSPGVPGHAEAGDRFGAAITMLDVYLLVGAPGEDVGTARDAGTVLLLTEQNADSRRFKVERAITPGRGGVPGVPGVGDRFGAAVAVTYGVICPDTPDLAIGAPGRDVDGRPAAGAVTLVEFFPAPECPPVVLRPGSGLPGEPAAHDAVGSVLGTSLAADLQRWTFDGSRLLVGVPARDVEGRVDAGAVLSSGPLIVNGSAVTTLTRSTGLAAGTGYGQVFAQPFA